MPRRGRPLRRPRALTATRRSPASIHFSAKEIVGVSHGNLARVKELVSKHQTLAKASWDWGFGDWETALGAASHVGNRAIAEFLIETGAPPTIFSAATLGQLDIVEAFAAAIPNVNRLRGPHGIPLINHARAGGAQAAEVLEYLESLGDVPKTGDLEPLSAADRGSLEGRSVWGSPSRCVHGRHGAERAGNRASGRDEASADPSRKTRVSSCRSASRPNPFLSARARG